MAKHLLLRRVDLTALSVALDHAEEHGPWKVDKPDPQAAPAECIYLRYAGAEQVELLARRLPHAEVQFSTLASGPKRKVVRKVFHKATILHILAFLFREEDAAEQFVRSLDTVSKRCWKAL
jgi:hypothetical protein